MDILTTLGFTTDFWIHAANFIVLIALLSYFLYRPIVRMLDERTQRIQESLAAAERAQADVARADREREELLATTRREIGEMMAQAQSVAERIQSEARTNAQQEAQRIVETARQEAEAERAQAMAELRREVASLAVLAAERIIKKEPRRAGAPATGRRVPRRAATDAGRPGLGGEGSAWRGRTSERSASRKRPSPSLWSHSSWTPGSTRSTRRPRSTTIMPRPCF